MTLGSVLGPGFPVQDGRVNAEDEGLGRAAQSTHLDTVGQHLANLAQVLAHLL